MQNTYTASEVSQILQKLGTSCFAHPERNIETQELESQKPYGICRAGHHFTLEYFWARKQNTNVFNATKEISVLLNRLDLETPMQDFHWSPVELEAYPLTNFSESLEYWDTRGISESTLRHYHVGKVDNTPVIPFYDIRGVVVGYFARDPQVPVNEPFQSLDHKCWHVPKESPRNTRWATYILHCPPTPKPESQSFVVVVEGILDAMRCLDAGYWAVAMNGGCLSRSQMAELKTLTRNVVLFADSDATGKKASQKPTAIQALFPFFNVQIVDSDLAKDPNSMTTEAVKSLLDSIAFT